MSGVDPSITGLLKLQALFWTDVALDSLSFLALFFHFYEHTTLRYDVNVTVSTQSLGKGPFPPGLNLFLKQ